VGSYYAETLAGERLRRCYELASPRVQQYLEAEIQYVLGHLRTADAILELGCGYGRVALRLAEVAGRVVGIDTAAESLRLARQLDTRHRCEFLEMDGLRLGFADGLFDAVVCVQNGVCAFGVDQEALVREALRVTRPGGLVLLSTYTDGFWAERLAWFEAQAAAGLIGKIARAESGDGVIVTEDGFCAGRLTQDGFNVLCSAVDRKGTITEVDGSSVFCTLVK
jgi:2-polyprenyl-6-hydroxyphenyl methylase/3-demethylubiquinone-9 3-methyltransferase